MCPCDPTTQTVCGRCRDRILFSAAQRDQARATHDFAAAQRITAALGTYGWKADVVLGQMADPAGGQP